MEGDSINRNIVECKELYCGDYQSLDNVLIETLWNVKVSKYLPSCTVTTVLIETLWNVKLHIWRTTNQTRLVLIETLWNVK